MSLHSVEPIVLGFHAQRPVVLEASAAQLSSDAGLLPIRQFDEQISFTEAFINAIQDTRDPMLTRHAVLTLVRQRLYGMLADYEDQNDAETYRSDPIFKLLVGRLPDEPFAGFRESGIFTSAPVREPTTISACSSSSSISGRYFAG